MNNPVVVRYDLWLKLLSIAGAAAQGMEKPPDDAEFEVVEEPQLRRSTGTFNMIFNSFLMIPYDFL